MDWNHKSGLIATACGDDAIRIFKEDGEENSNSDDQTSFSMLTQVEGAHKQDVNSINWNPKDETLLASCSDDETVKIWKIVSE